MSEQFPPPGGADQGSTPSWFPPPGPTYPGPTHPGPTYVGPGYLGPGQPALAAHKPGAVPLRPLRLGDIFDAAFKIVRFNPQATVGAAALLALVTMAPTIAVAIGLATSDHVLSNTTDSVQLSDFGGLIALFGAYVTGAVAKGIGTVLLTGVIAHVVMAATIGRRLSLAEAWAATRGRRWRLLALMLGVTVATLVVLGLVLAFWYFFLVTEPSGALIALVLLLTLVPLVVLGSWVSVRCVYLATPALMLEDATVLGSVGRALELSRGQFWRISGIILLTGTVAAIAGYIVALPFSIVGQIGGAAVAGSDIGRLFAVLTLASALGSVVSTALVTPFTAAVTGLQYVDQRMRKEAFDIELMRRAGILGA